jgi:hypothetical protein
MIKEGMVNIGRVKDGATFATPDGTIYQLINNKQMVDGCDHGGAEYAEVKRIWRAKRLRDNRMFHFAPKFSIILLEGELAW